eukprot:13363814-Ditylum_brightwellii.AAC.1
MEGADFHTSEVKQSTMKEYLSQVCKILNANLLGDSMMTAICAYAVPILCHTFVIMKWTRAELCKLDGKYVSFSPHMDFTTLNPAYTNCTYINPMVVKASQS